MKTFQHGIWHAWQANNCILLSDESVKRLRQFKTVDDCINWLFLNDAKDTARALNKHYKEGAK